MLDEKDIQRLKEELVTKEDLEEFSVKVFQTFVTKEEINELRKEIAALRESIQTLTISVEDKLAKLVEDMHSRIYSYNL
jgi:DNA-binding GntR family transcriptional regulator